ncbi:hypothetical protein [Methylobacterium trifolii]|uniref:Uncharacterized protein n=1 Tax=Methylobacterium trifolii TaxID=1003092 RepID=A0ABQ4TZW0_9HYPH|nr:hypothetical protein [Methylobacterium trifolii]GJE60736.1 hypothetical protein MPOCJGCO_2852 [Methylobacterium trifolii]
MRRGGAPLPQERLEDLEGGRQAVLELRKRVADRIEADLALLDALDGDPDLEPSLGAVEPFDWQGQGTWAAGNCDERENADCVDCDGEAAFFPTALRRCA